MQEKVEIVKADGTKASLDLISEFEINNGSLKKYVLMTANELIETYELRKNIDGIYDEKRIPNSILQTMISDASVIEDEWLICRRERIEMLRELYEEVKNGKQ